ncbi:acyltransferase [Calidifontibacter sp. DB0510]|uniref:Acyltransferase n=1 Tax=Metallococcus carri TaxID=1656884 RepID=A0A967B1H8_9MICO|nr:acyltransferase [Metallococcus carri]NHN56573.1 acyltransferase [Metallococcus carri]NOP38872.1 acyltransferase [Calidifontibacter sp. DB2511S]
MSVPVEDRARGRFGELDALRGIAACAVVAFHYTTLFDEFFPGHRRFPVTFRAGALGVQLFFMISGFVILMTARQKRSARAFGLARAVRLYPTYWACVTVTLLVTSATGVSVLGQPADVVAVNYTMLQSFLRVRDLDGAYWSLAREITFYLIVAAALVVMRGRLTSRVTTRIAVVWTLFGLALCTLSWMRPGNVTHLLVSATASQYAPLFSFGMVMYEMRLGQRRGLLLPAFLALAATATQGLIEGWRLAPVVFLLTLAFAAVTLTNRFAWLNTRVLLWLGAVSYPLYLLHQNIGYAIIVRTDERLGPYGSRLIAFAVVLALAWGVHEVIERRLTRAISVRLRARPAPPHAPSAGGEPTNA